MVQSQSHLYFDETDRHTSSSHIATPVWPCPPRGQSTICRQVFHQSDKQVYFARTLVNAAWRISDFIVDELWLSSMINKHINCDDLKISKFSFFPGRGAPVYQQYRYQLQCIAMRQRAKTQI